MRLNSVVFFIKFYGEITHKSHPNSAHIHPPSPPGNLYFVVHKKYTWKPTKVFSHILYYLHYNHTQHLFTNFTLHLPSLILPKLTPPSPLLSKIRPKHKQHHLHFLSRVFWKTSKLEAWLQGLSNSKIPLLSSLFLLVHQGYEPKSLFVFCVIQDLILERLFTKSKTDKMEMIFKM